MIAIGRETNVRGDIFGMGSATKWTKIENDETLTAEISPQRVLAMLRSATQDTRRLGEEIVRGVDTVRYRLEVDCEQADLDCDGATAPVEVWVGEDGLVRRIALRTGRARARSSSTTSGSSRNRATARRAGRRSPSASWA